MLKNYVGRERKEVVNYRIQFYYDENGGYAFDCDENGKPTLEYEAARKNYEYCLAHPEEFMYYNKLGKITHVYYENAHGTCECGNEVSLYDQYMGACECEKCGRWYNLFGQELNPPSAWEEDW